MQNLSDSDNESSDYRHHSDFIDGVRFVQAFVQSNFTGPCATMDLADEDDADFDLQKLVSEDGEEPYSLLKFPSRLHKALNLLRNPALDSAYPLVTLILDVTHVDVHH